MTSALAPAPSKLAAERKKSAERGRRLGSRTGNTIAGIAAWAIGILFVFPVFFMVLTSLHSEPNASTNPPSFFAPLTLDGYREFFGASSGASPWPPLINSATASIIAAARSLGVVDDQAWKARWAAPTARVASSGPASAAVPTTSPVAGSVTSNEASVPTHSPST